MRSFYSPMLCLHMMKIGKYFKRANLVIFLGLSCFFLVRWFVLLIDGNGKCNEIGCTNVIMFGISATALTAYMFLLGIFLLVNMCRRSNYSSQTANAPSNSHEGRK